MTIAWLLVVVGIVGLVWSADRFVAGSAALAHNFGISKMVIGLTIVSLGTSAPEIIVSLDASFRGVGELAIGNALGSNIANVGLVLAITALVAAIPIQRHLLNQDVPILLLVTALAGLFLLDGNFRRWEGAVLLLSLGPLMYFMYRIKSKHPEEVATEDIPTLSNASAVFWFLAGLVALVISARLLVNGATTIAAALGVSDLVVGLTVVAIGTSLPELAASVMSALKGHHDIALGNIVGSNIFNLLTVMAIPGLVGVGVVQDTVFYRDYIAMATITGLLCLIIFAQFYWDKFHPQSLSRRLLQGIAFRRTASQPKLAWPVGVLLLLSYVGYSVILFYSETTPAS